MNTPDEYYYLAGPMTGYPGFNFAAFDEAAATLRAGGTQIVSPAELDAPDEREWNMASPDGANSSRDNYHRVLVRDAQFVLDTRCKGIITLPGWEHSTGARMECFLAHTLGKPIFEYNDNDPVLLGGFKVTMGGVTK